MWPANGKDTHRACSLFLGVGGLCRRKAILVGRVTGGEKDMETSKRTPSMYMLA